MSACFACVPPRKSAPDDDRADSHRTATAGITGVCREDEDPHHRGEAEDAEQYALEGEIFIPIVFEFSWGCEKYTVMMRSCTERFHIMEPPLMENASASCSVTTCSAAGPHRHNCLPNRQEETFRQASRRVSFSARSPPRCSTWKKAFASMTASERGIRFQRCVPPKLHNIAPDCFDDALMLFVRSKLDVLQDVPCTSMA